MFRSAELQVGLLALLRGIRSIRHALKSFILRCLLFWPHVLRRFRRIWSLFSGTGPKDSPKKTEVQARPSSSRVSGGCEGYSTIYASRVNRAAGEPNSLLGPGNAEVLPLSPIVGQSQSTPHSPASSLAPSLPGSPQRSNRRLSAGSTNSIASSRNADSIHGTRQYIIRHLHTPLTSTHSREISAQFAGAPSSRPRPPSPSPSTSSHPYPLPQSITLEGPAASPGPSRAPSPSPYPQPQPLPQSSILEDSGNTQFPNMVPIPQDASEGHRQPDIRISPPSRSQTVELDSHLNFPESPISFQQGHLPGPSQFPTPGTEHPTPGPSNPGGFTLAHGNARHSSGSLLTLSANQARVQLSFPRPYTSQVSVVNLPVADTSGSWSDGKTRSIGLMHPEQVSRYMNKGDVLQEDSGYRLIPMEVDLPQYSHAKRPKGWAPATHPGGALYFYNAERRIFTDVYMYDSDLSAEIHAFAAYLDKRTSPLPTNNYDLVLDIIKTEDDEIIWAYYYVDHDTKTLFWQDYYECGYSLLREVRGVVDASHVRLRLESLYWVHWSLYPAGPESRKFPKNAPNELLGALLSSGIDSLTSKVSTSPYTVAEMESMRGFIKEAESLGPENPHVITSVARLLSFYAHWRYLHFHGQKTSRQDRYKSIYKGSRRKRTIIIRVLSPMLFFFPDVHLLELEKVWTDKIVVEALWKEFMQKLVSEWTEFVLYSTVMLAANVAFLAIPGVIVVPQYPIPPDAWIKPSPAQIASSISLVFSIGSIITGLLLIRRNRTMMTKDPRSAWHYLHGMEWRVVGLEPLAIVFSLTYALLMWSAWVFFVALLIFSFQDTSRRIRISVGTAAGIVAMLIVWCITNTWDPEEREEEPIDWPYEPPSEPQVGNGTQA